MAPGTGVNAAGLPFPIHFGSTSSFVVSVDLVIKDIHLFQVFFDLLQARLQSALVELARGHGRLPAARSPLSIILICALIYLVVTFSKPVLLILAISYVGVGVATRIGGAVRRRLRPQPQPPREPEHQVG